MGLRYKLHDKSLPGRPDLTFPKYKVVLNINGCFWHGHKGNPCFAIPKTKTEWWAAKIQRTVDRDISNNTRLIEMGWRVITIWECELKKGVRIDTLRYLYDKITQPGHYSLV
jgi:DNA mismatch endonuclease (patch repair protein)